MWSPPDSAVRRFSCPTYYLPHLIRAVETGPLWERDQVNITAANGLRRFDDYFVVALGECLDRYNALYFSPARLCGDFVLNRYGVGSARRLIWPADARAVCAGLLAVDVGCDGGQLETTDGVTLLDAGAVVVAPMQAALEFGLTEITRGTLYTLQWAFKSP